MVYTSPLSILIMVIQLEIEDFIALPTLLFTSIHFISHPSTRFPRRFPESHCSKAMIFSCVCTWSRVLMAPERTLRRELGPFFAMVARVADRKTTKKWTKDSTYEDFGRIFFYVAFWGACHFWGPKTNLKKQQKQVDSPVLVYPMGTYQNDLWQI